jgi:chemotaxis protein CheZ
MAVQRKVFRIEERARKRAPEGAVRGEPGLAPEVASELRALRAIIAPSATRAACELREVIVGTEQATHAILAATEAVMQATDTVQGESGDEIRAQALRIIEACNFHDITSQRVDNVLAALRSIEDRTVRLMAIWQRIERFEPISPCDDSGDGRFLNGPKLPSDHGHSTQDEIDRLFACG